MAKTTIPESRKREIIEAAKAHILLVGPQRWDEVQANFPEVSRATFFRLIDQARKEMENQAAAQGSGALKVAQKRIKARVEAPEKTQAKVKAQLPAAPSPAIVAGMGAAAEDVFDFMAYFKTIVSDADLIRQSMMVVDPATGLTKVKNPVLLDRNISRRLDIIESWLHSQQLVFNLERIQELYRAVIEAVGQADPDTQRAILSRLRQLNKERGLTIGMGA